MKVPRLPFVLLQDSCGLEVFYTCVWGSLGVAWVWSGARILINFRAVKRNKKDEGTPDNNNPEHLKNTPFIDDQTI